MPFPISLLALALLSSAPPAAPGPTLYRPKLRVPEALAPYLEHVRPGRDAFPSEKEAEALALRLREWGETLRRQGPRQAGDAARGLFAPGFRGARLRPVEETMVVDGSSLRVVRARALSSARDLDAPAFAAELGALLTDFETVETAELLITALDLEDGGLARSEVRYDVVGRGRAGGRAQCVGRWALAWSRPGAGPWLVAEWSALQHQASRAASPLFAEVTGAAFGALESFRRQLTIGLDAWSATLDSGVTRDSNGHHGVSVGDFDGDGRDDLYVAQPEGLPNRLYRARGDGTFEDATQAAGLDVLDDTTMSLFADVDNDGDQDLVLVLSAGPALFENDGKGRFTRKGDAFRFAEPLKGMPMSVAMADYDQDGFLDLYLCVYSFYYGAGEGKGGAPMPYHDARNGPPSVLFRNDGQGRFRDVTREAGLETGNDRYHFAAAWGDYDADGWIDLLVANDFGRKNLYRNLGPREGRVVFEDVAGKAGVEDHGAGMSAAFLDYDNDGRLDIYTGNMWSDAGRRVTGSAAFMPDAPAEVRSLYARHARGNSLFRNRGDGGFEDVTLGARVEMGRWAWSSDALDFDGDGFEDLYVVNGMLTRERATEDLDGFFWRQVVARSPLQPVVGTPYDDAWRAINLSLVHQSIAARQRNVLYRNDGAGGFDDVSGTAGLDLDQDGRSFAVFDHDADGDPDLAVLAVRGAPQLRLFRNDGADGRAALAVRLRGTRGNRDAVGARVTVETDLFRRTKMVSAGSGFLSQHSKELLFGLGASRRVVRVSVAWPGGGTQVFEDVALGQRLVIVEGSSPVAEPLAAPPRRPADAEALRPAAPPAASWLYEPFPAPDFALADASGAVRSLAALRGRPALVLLFSTEAKGADAALRALSAGQGALAQAGVASLAVALDPAAPASAAGVPVVAATADVARGFAILYRHLFMNRQPLPLPTALLLDAGGGVVKAYREVLDVAEVLRDAPRIDAPAAERLARAVPFPRTRHQPAGVRNYLPYGQELLEEGLEGAAVAAFERAAQGNPTASTLYRLGTLLVRGGQAGKARDAFERALALQPELSEASNDLGALLAQGGDLPAAIARFRAALAAAPDYPDALNNLGYALLQTGRAEQARGLYEKALALQPDFPEALNNLGLIHARAGDLDKAEPYFRDALARRPGYGEAATNVALVLVNRGRADEAVAHLEAFLLKEPAHENAYVALARIQLTLGRKKEALLALERLLQRNPKHELGLALVQQAR